MTPFSNGIKYKADELMYLIFDHSEGRVYEISKSFLSYGMECIEFYVFGSECINPVCLAYSRDMKK